MMSRMFAVILLSLCAGAALAVDHNTSAIKTDVQPVKKDYKKPVKQEVVADTNTRRESATRTAIDAPALYQQGLQQEASGDMANAMKSFLASANAGFSPAMRKLSDIYNKGNSFIPRDYASAIKWHHDATEAGEIFRELMKR